MRKTSAALLGVIAVALSATLTTSAHADSGKKLGHKLSGLSQVPVVISPAGGRFKAKVTGNQIQWTLRAKDLASDVTGIHLHLGRRSQNGTVVVALCDDEMALSDLSVTACTGLGEAVGENKSMWSGAFGSAEVKGSVEQGFPEGDMALLSRLMKAGLIYVNVHTVDFPNGELRGPAKLSGKYKKDKNSDDDDEDDSDDDEDDSDDDD